MATTKSLVVVGRLFMFLHTQTRGGTAFVGEPYGPAVPLFCAKPAVPSGRRVGAFLRQLFLSACDGNLAFKFFIGGGDIGHVFGL